MNKPVQTYARRLARMCFLRQMCPDDHPVVQTERKLLEMARSSLQQEVLSRFGQDRISVVRPLIETEIRRIARSRIDSQVEDGSFKERLRSEIDSSPLDCLFTVMN